MKQRTRIPGKRSKARRRRPELFKKRERDPRFLDPRSYVTKGGRVRLFGQDYENLRNEARRRSMDNFGVPCCECGCRRPTFAHLFTYPWEKGELSHNEHGPRKSDELHRVKWMRHECHMRSHNCGGKPNPKKDRAVAAVNRRETAA